MKINSKQLKAMWAGIGLLVLAGLFPPWMDTDANEIYGFSFIGHPAYKVEIAKPHAPDLFDKYFPDSKSELPPRTYANHIDTSRLFIEWVIIAVLTFGLIVTFKSDNKSVKPEAKQAEQA